jgi:hypothetical protein
MIVNDTACITCYFNFHGYSATKRNLRRYHRYMEAYGIPSYGVELAYHGVDFVSEGWDGWRQIRVLRNLHTLFQKEAALNVCVKHVPPQYTEIAIIDCDVFFQNPEWLSQTSAVLNVVNACSPYGTACWTDHEGKVELTRASFGADPKGLIPHWRCHPGFAMAMRRDFWSPDGPNGLYPFYAVGQGDTALGIALAGLEPKHKMFETNNCLPSYLEWYDKVQAWVTGISYVDGLLFHEYHGTRENRKYVDRTEWIKPLDPSIHLKFNDDGLLEWTEAAPKTMVEDVAAYFSIRKEDD